jgi:hypothetical protein
LAKEVLPVVGLFWLRVRVKTRAETLLQSHHRLTMKMALRLVVE